MKRFIKFASFLLIAIVACQQNSKQLTDAQLKEKAEKLAREFILIDTHIDVPYRLNKNMEDISIRTEKGDFDYPRAKKGGLNVPFMSIYIPASYQTNGGAKLLADSLINLVESIAEKSPDKFAVAKSVSDVREQIRSGKISLAMGMENGAPIEGSFENLKHFFNRGIRYITLTHGKDNHISDSSYDTTHKWNGLSPFGKTLIPEMNKLGIMVDISHVTDSTFYQVLRITKAPVIASHSSCRFFTPGWGRNISDDMIKKLAKNGGVVQINFGSSFLKEEIQKHSEKVYGHVQSYVEEHHLNDHEAEEYMEKYMQENPPGYADVSDVVAHIDHVVQLVGVDYVGIGSDFDGLGDSLPTGLKDVSFYPNLIFHLLKKGYSEEDIKKICGENLLRVWSQVEQTAKNFQSNASL